jgi:hypothetical protein
VIRKFEDIFPLLPPEGAKRWDPQPLAQAIGKSEFQFTPNHYYELLDKHVHPDITKIVSARAGLFYDPNALALDQQQQRARQGHTPSTIPVTASNFLELFEFFNDRKNEFDAAEAKVGPLAPQGSSETTSAYERRARTRLESLVKARGPSEGEIDATSFALDLPAGVVERDGCKRSVTSMDMSEITLDLFRAAAGTTATNSPISVAGSSTVESARFTLEAPKRFEVVGRCGTTATKLRMTVHRTWDGHWSGQGGF